MLNPQSHIDRLFHALSDPTRRAILARLCISPLSVSLLAAPLNITLTAVTQHLQVLEASGLVRTEKVGRVRTCHIKTDGFLVLEQWIREHRSIWEHRLDQLGELLDQPDDEPLSDNVKSSSLSHSAELFIDEGSSNVIDPA